MTLTDQFETMCSTKTLPMVCSIAISIYVRLAEATLALYSNNNLASGSEGVKHKTGLETKIADLRHRFDTNRVHFIEGANLLTVRRSHVLEDSREQFNRFNNRKELKILFEGENKTAATDAGGLTKEWFTLVAEELLSPENKYFTRCDADEVSYFINEESEEEKDKEDKFYFVGLFIAKALFDKIPINLCLSKAIYKYILGEDGMDLEE